MALLQKKDFFEAGKEKISEDLITKIKEIITNDKKKEV